MEEITYGDYALIEVALNQFYKDLDSSLHVTQEVQRLIIKIEVQIQKLQAAAAEQGDTALIPPPALEPQPT